MFDAPGLIAREIAQRVPGIRDVIDALATGLMALASYAAPSEVKGPRSLHRIINQANNDLLDLLFDCMHGRGRPAIRTARTLFELAIAMLDVLDSAESDARYSAHWYLEGLMLSRLTREAAALHGTEREELQARMDRLRSSAQEAYDEAIREYGSRYPASWTEARLKERAQRHGLSDDYETFYAWSSVATHATAAGLHGLWRSIGGEPVYRFGVALEPCPTALIYGLAYFQIIFDKYEKLYDAASGIPILREALSQLRRVFPDYRRAVLQIDEEFWPRAPVSNAITIYGMGPHGTGRWYVLDQQQGRIITADLVEPLPEAVSDGLREMRSQFERYDVWGLGSSLKLGPTGLVVIHVVDAIARPRQGADWQHPSWIMPPISQEPGLAYVQLSTASIVSGRVGEELALVFQEWGPPPDLSDPAALGP